MECCISFGMFDFKLILYCILYIILEIANNIFFYNNNEASDNKDNENLFKKHKLLYLLFFYLGYFFNFIPELIVRRKSNQYENFLPKKDIIKFVLVSLISLLIDFIQIILDEFKEEKEYYENDFLFIGALLIFYIPKCSEKVYYKHQNISFLIFIFLEFINIIFYLLFIYQ